MYDVIIIGAGHNGLVAACYLARAGLKNILILEKNKNTGGAAVSQQPFSGIDARLSRYSYLVSMLPDKIVQDLELQFSTKKRTIASCTPTWKNGEQKTLLISNISEEATKESFREFTGNEEEYERFKTFSEMTAILGSRLASTLLEPLRSKEDVRSLFQGDFEEKVWDMFLERPLGEVIEATVQDDAVRGLLFTDAKVGVSDDPHELSLIQNRTFLYHYIGNGTGEWKIPLGGMGALTRELEEKARSLGVQILTEADVQTISPEKETATVQYRHDGKTVQAQGRFVLSNVAPEVLSGLLPQPLALKPSREGSIFKVNMVLKRLPQLKAHLSNPQDAFIGTFHMYEGYEQMKQSYQSAQAGKLPDKLPCEMYCHSLTDNSILSGELAAQGYHTLTLFGMDMPYSLFEKDNDRMRKEVLSGYMRAMNEHFIEPIEECLATDSAGNLCFEAKTPVDIERELGMPKGNIFHCDLSWPFAETDQEVGAWGVEIPGYKNIFICGSGAKRGGCVSGIPGHNAAMKVLEYLK